MPSTTAWSNELGTLSALPREIRDTIYGFVLDFTTPPTIEVARNPLQQKVLRTSLLCASRCIHSEAQIVLYQINEFGIWIDYDYNSNKENQSIMGRPGYRVDFGLQEGFKEWQEDCYFKEPPSMEMLRHMQFMHLQVGTYAGIREYDIVPTRRQTVSGPERPTYRSLVEVVEDMCEKLKQCHQIHILRVSLRSIEKTPGSVEKVMDPIRNLRGIKKTNPVVFAMQEDQWVDWNLKGSYGRYMNKIMAMPEGTVVPKYVGDEKEPNQNENNIFDMVGGKWLGGRSFAMPRPDGDDDIIEFGVGINEEEDMDSEDAWVDEEDDEFEMFMEAMESGNYEEAFSIAHGGPFGPGFTTGIPPDDLHDFVPTMPELQEHHFGPGLHHCHHHHHHHEAASEDEAPESGDDLSLDESLD